MLWAVMNLHQINSKSTVAISNTDISKIPSYIKEKSLDTLPTFLYISALVIKNCWYLKVNFLGPENLL